MGGVVQLMLRLAPRHVLGAAAGAAAPNSDGDEAAGAAPHAGAAAAGDEAPKAAPKACNTMQYTRVQLGSQ